MIIPDINLLLYAYVSTFPDHLRARRWWEDRMNGSEAVGLVGPVVFGFIRIATNSRVFSPPMTIETATAHVESWLARPAVVFLAPGPRHLEIALGLLRATRATPSLTTDCQLAAFAIENQAELHSNDADFARFSGLRWVNPLV